MARTQRIFISDIHLNAKELYDSKVAWYNGTSHRSRLLEFLNKQVINQAGTIKDVVILGDFFDAWTCPADEKPPTWSELFKSNSKEMKAFKKIVSKGINLFCVRGNHDFDLPGTMLKQALPGIRVINSYKGAGRSHAEHGHLHTLFNHPDYLNDPGFGRPIGYFISRLFASSPGSGKSFLDVLDYLDDVIEAIVTPSTLFESIIEALAERADVDEIVMPGNKKISVQDVKDRYKNLAKQHGLGLGQLKSYIFQEKNLGNVGDELCKKWGFNIVLFGHTHNAKIDKDWFFTEDRIYANAGNWCEEKAHCVIIEKFPIKSGVNVILAEVDDNGNIVRKQKRSLG